MTYGNFSLVIRSSATLAEAGPAYYVYRTGMCSLPVRRVSSKH